MSTRMNATGTGTIGMTMRTTTIKPKQPPAAAGGLFLCLRAKYSSNIHAIRLLFRNPGFF